jgi:hypothetical protein
MCLAIFARAAAGRMHRFRMESGLYGCFPFFRVLAKTQSSGWPVVHRYPVQPQSPLMEINPSGCLAELRLPVICMSPSEQTIYYIRGDCDGLQSVMDVPFIFWT